MALPILTRTPLVRGGLLGSKRRATQALHCGQQCSVANVSKKSSEESQSAVLDVEFRLKKQQQKNTPMNVWIKPR